MSLSLQKLVILHTNDLHSHFGAMPKIDRFIQEHRASLPSEELLVIDCGDHMDRAFIETEGTDGEANIAVMNATGYDAAVPGNNEGLTFDIDTLQRLYGQLANFPVIGSNMFMADGGRPPWLKSHLIIRKGSLNIGLIGVTIDFTAFYELLGWDIRDPFACVAELVKELRSEVDILIVVSHLGIRYDERLAEQIPGIDIILGAHTHHLLEQPLVIGDTIICAAGKFGDHIGRLELVYDHQSNRIADIKGTCFETSGMEDSMQLASLIARYRVNSERNLSQVVARLTEDLAIDWHRESRLGNLLALGIRNWCRAPISLVNSGQLLDGLNTGEVTRGRLLEICPSPINPCKMKLYGYEIRQVLEQSLMAEYQNKPIRGFGFRGKILGMLCVSGMTIEVYEDRPFMSKIGRILIEGEELDDQQLVEVATIDMFTFGIGYPTISNGREVEFFLPEFLRDILLHELQDPEQIERSGEAHWIYV